MTVDSLTEDHSGLIDGNSFLLCTRTCHNNGQENDGMELHYYLLHYPGLGEPEGGGREQIPKSMHMYAAADLDATITPTPAVSHNESAWSFGCRPSAARRGGPPAEAQRSEL